MGKKTINWWWDSSQSFVAPLKHCLKQSLTYLNRINPEQSPWMQRSVMALTVIYCEFYSQYDWQSDSFPPQGPPGLPGMKGDSGSKGEKARHYYDANLKWLHCVFLISAYTPYLKLPQWANILVLLPPISLFTLPQWAKKGSALRGAFTVI